MKENRMRRARETAGLSIGQAAIKLGVERSVIEQFEAADVDDIYEEGVAFAGRCAELYGVNTDWMLGQVEQYDYATADTMKGAEKLTSHDRDIVAEFAASMPRGRTERLSSEQIERMQRIVDGDDGMRSIFIPWVNRALVELRERRAADAGLERIRAAARAYVSAVSRLEMATFDTPEVMAAAGPIGEALADLWIALGIYTDEEIARLRAEDERCIAEARPEREAELDALARTRKRLCEAYPDAMRDEEIRVLDKLIGGAR